MTTRVVSVDPGKRSGVVYAEVDSWLDGSVPRILLEEEVYDGVEGFIDFVETSLPDTLDVIVCEDFVYHGRLGADVEDPLKVIGAVHVLARETGASLMFQTPGGRKQSVSNEALIRLGWYRAGKANRNMLEAYRHLAWYLKNTKHRGVLLTAFPPPED